MNMCSLGVQLNRVGLIVVAVLALFFFTSCMQGNVPSQQQSSSQPQVQQPTIEAAPVQQSGDQWKVASSENVTLTVTAPGAQAVKILYRPVDIEGRHLELASVRTASDAQGKFVTQIKVGPDFAGDVWAEAVYQNRAKQRSSPISLTSEAAASATAQNPSANTDESAREDKLTGGRIEHAAFQPGQPNILITVNAPAFELTLWQNGKEVKTYQIGIGRKQFPLPPGARKATQIVFNPEWVPPDSSWVEDDDVTPGERIEPDDPRNPLGKIKIPLGQGILIHEARKPTDIGHLVSHGCVRLVTDDLFDLTEKIVEARSLPITQQQIENLRQSKERMAVKLDTPLGVDINYDTQVIEGGVLHIYPDVYNRNTNTIENLRAELQGAGIDAAAIDDQTLQQMLARVTMDQQFVVPLAEVKNSRALIAGRTEPITQESKPAKEPRHVKRAAHASRGR